MLYKVMLFIADLLTEISIMAYSLFVYYY